MNKKQSNAIKGIAIVLMIFYHLFQHEERIIEFGLQGTVSSLETMKKIIFYGHLCVPLFAFMTGYGLAKSQNTSPMRKAPLHRYKIFIGDIAYILFFCIFISVLINAEHTPSAVWGENVLDIILGIITNILGAANIFGYAWFDSSWWYISLNICFIFSFPFVYSVIKKVGIETSIGLTILLPTILGWNVVDDGFGRYFISFAFGIVLSESKFFEGISERVFQSKLNKRITALVICFLSILVMAVVRYRFDKQYLIETAIAISVIIFIYLLCHEIRILETILSVFGENSKYMWLIHVFVYAHWGNFRFMKLKNICKRKIN